MPQQQIKIGTIRDYELYVKAMIKENMGHRSQELQDIVQETALKAFQDGISFTQNKLEVTIWN